MLANGYCRLSHLGFLVRVRRRTPQVRRELGHSTDISSLAIDLARSGTGVALAQCWLAQDELRNGTLVMPFKTTIDLRYRYCAVHARGNARNPGVRAFVEWLCVQGAQL